MKTVLLLGGFQPGQSQWSMREGFERIGWRVVYMPSRGCIKSQLEGDVALAHEESDLIPPPDQWQIVHDEVDSFVDAIIAKVRDEQVDILLWWTNKDDCPPGVIAKVRQACPSCKTVTHTQDDPWNAVRHPEYSADFEFAATCCVESVDVYAQRDVKAIVLYPPPAESLHGQAVPTPHEECDFSVTMMSLYDRKDRAQTYDVNATTPADAVTHGIGFPEQRVMRTELVESLAELGRVHVYGGLGAGTFRGLPRWSYRGFRTYSELPSVYQSAKININQHNSPLSHGYLNQRDTAITGSGGFMLTDYVVGIEDIFDVGKEIDTWKSLDELKDKAQWWLDHDDQRQQAAKRAQQRIMTNYGNIAYARKLVEFVGL